MDYNVLALWFVLRIWLPLAGTIPAECAMLAVMGERRGNVYVASVLMNVVTNVSLNVCLAFSYHSTWTDVAIGEVVVLVVETVWFWCVLRQWKKAAVYSFLCNAASFLFGLILNILFL